MSTFQIRPAAADDLPAMARLAAQLVRQHHAADPLRFFMPDDVEGGYRHWFARELANPDVILRVAERGDRLLGYAYARREPRDWNALLDSFGAVHDLFVEEEARGAGVGAALLRAALDGLAALGAARAVLSTMWSNAPAQRLFARAGFRNTMIEMTCELGGSK